MLVKEVSARVILDSRKEETIEISVNACRTSSPSGKSKGKHEAKSYIKTAKGDAHFINTRIKELVEKNKFPEVFYFGDLEKIEKLLKNKVGANTLYAFEASVLKALAVEKKVELFQVINHKLNQHSLKKTKFPRILSNTIGGGAHSNNKIKPDFQEFLVSCDKNPSICEKINKIAYREAEFTLKQRTHNSLKVNDENAWQTDLDNEEILGLFPRIDNLVFQEAITHLNVGIDCAASQFYNSKIKKYI
jgi:enolase